jgi:hypothetical protein
MNHGKEEKGEYGHLFLSSYCPDQPLNSPVHVHHLPGIAEGLQGRAEVLSNGLRRIYPALIQELCNNARDP